MEICDFVHHKPKPGHITNRQDAYKCHYLRKSTILLPHTAKIPIGDQREKILRNKQI